MKIIFALILLISVQKVGAQDVGGYKVNIPDSVKTFPGGKCYWGYGIERLDSSQGKTHNYVIRFFLEQEDSTGKNVGILRVKGANIVCKFKDRGKITIINFIPHKDAWIADFMIHTNKPLVIKLIANYYNNQPRTMKATLNKGTYPGEPD